MTPAEIWSFRFCCGRPAPSGDLRENLARQIEGDVPVLHNVYTDFSAAPPPRPYLSTWQVINEFKKAKLEGDAYKEAMSRCVPSIQDFWNPVLEYCRTGDRPFVGRLMLDQPNAAATFESRPTFVYSFWAHALIANMLRTHGDWLVAIILNHFLYRYYLNTNDNIGPNSAKGRPSLPPDENLARELHEILSVGPGFQNPSDMFEVALLLTGLRNDGYDPAYAEPGDRTIMGKTFAQGDIEGYLRWLAVHPKTAETQVRRMVLPLLGRNLTPALSEHLQQVWLDTGGNRRAVLTAMVLHDAAWAETRGAPVNTLVGYATHMFEHNVPWPPQAYVRWAQHLGYEYERAPDPEGLPNDERLIGASQLLYRNRWPGTSEQRRVSMSHTRIVV